MKLKFIFLGKQDTKFTGFQIDKYLKRLNNFCKYEVLFISEKNHGKLDKKVNKHINRRTHVIVLDENGKIYNTLDYSNFLYSIINDCETLLFVVGDAYGLPLSLLDKANSIISLSKMTFPHHIARLILVEQTYRAFTVINNHPYHHE